MSIFNHLNILLEPFLQSESLVFDAISLFSAIHKDTGLTLNTYTSSIHVFALVNYNLHINMKLITTQTLVI